MSIFKNPFRKSPNPKSAEAALNRGLSCMRDGDHKRAFREFDEAVGLDPNSPRVRHIRGLAYLTVADHEMSKADLDVAIRLDPARAPNYHYERGNAYCEIQEYSHALSEFDIAISLNPEFADAYHNRGVAKTRNGHPEEGIADFDRAIKLNPNDAENYTARGNAWLALDNLTSAMADFTLASDLDPRNTSAYTLKARIHESQGDLEQSISEYTKAIEVNPNEPDAFANRGDNHAYLGDYANAIVDYKEVLRLCPDITAVIQFTHRIATSTHDIEQNPKDAAGYLNRGEAYRFWRKNHELAIQNFDRGIDLLSQAAEEESSFMAIHRACAVAYQSRGKTNFSRGNFAESRMDANMANLHSEIDRRLTSGEQIVPERTLGHTIVEQSWHPYGVVQPGVEQVYFDLGNAYAETQQYTLAILCYKESVTFGSRGERNREIIEHALHNMDICRMRQQTLGR